MFHISLSLWHAPSALEKRLLQLLYGVGQVHHFCSELRHESLQLFDWVQLNDLDALGVGVEADFEGARHLCNPLAELLLGVFEAFGDEVDWLVLLILVRLDCGGCRVEWTVFWLVTHGMQQLAVSGQQTGAVRFDFVVFLAQAELNCEPVNLFGRKRIRITNWNWPQHVSGGFFAFLTLIAFPATFPTVVRPTVTAKVAIKCILMRKQSKHTGCLLMTMIDMLRSASNRRKCRTTSFQSSCYANFVCVLDWPRQRTINVISGRTSAVHSDNILCYASDSIEIHSDKLVDQQKHEAFTRILQLHDWRSRLTVQVPVFALITV